MRQVSADDAAVANDQHVLAVRVGGRNLRHGPHYPRLDVGQGLAARRQAGDGVAHPLRVRVARQCADLLHGEPLPFPQRQLTQVVHRGQREAEARGGDLGRPARALERARVDRGDPAVAEGLPERFGLACAQLGQRHVLRALKTAHGIGHGLSVAREEETLHRPTPAAARAVLRRASVSALPSSAATWKTGGLAALPVSAMRVSWARSTSLSPISAARPLYRPSRLSASHAPWASIRLISTLYRCGAPGPQNLDVASRSYVA